MATSDSSCGLCGEAPGKAGDLLWGCVSCNPERGRLARQPEVPVTPGPDGLGCIAHHELNCERCGLLETRTRLAMDDWKPNEDGSWTSTRTGGGGLTLLVIVGVMVLLAAGCLWYGISSIGGLL